MDHFQNLRISNQDVNPVYLAQSRLRRRRFDDANQICSDLLLKNPYDQAVWYLKARAITLRNWIDDTELEEEGAGEILLDDNSVQAVPRPGTSLSRPQTNSSLSQAMRPVSSAGRPMTGFARPGTSSRPLTGATGAVRRMGSSQGRVATALQGAKPGTARPTTTSGRFVRLGTASMASQPGGAFINVERLDLEKYASRPHLARVLCDYILYNDHNAKAAAVLCAAATVRRCMHVRPTKVADKRYTQDSVHFLRLQEKSNFGDWWWKMRLGICYYKLGLFPDSIKQLESSLQCQPIVTTALHLNKAFLRLDQPISAINMFSSLLDNHTGRPPHDEQVFKAAERTRCVARVADDIALMLGQARVQDALHEIDKSMALYKSVLHLDASNVESMACMASWHFYNDQPEIALRFYRRLLLMGVTNAELWNNLGLCCFYASQYDMTLRCFEQALVLSDDGSKADIWSSIMPPHPSETRLCSFCKVATNRELLIMSDTYPDLTLQKYNIGQVAIGMGDTNLAYQAFKVAVSVDGSHAESFNNLGVLESQRGNADAAATYFHTSQELGAALFEPFYNGALTAFKNGQLEKSFTQVQASLDNFPEHGDSMELQRLIRGLFCIA